MSDKPNECPKCGYHHMMQVRLNYQAGTVMYQCQDCGKCVTRSL